MDKKGGDIERHRNYNNNNQRNYKKNLLDENFDFEKAYFFREISSKQLEDIKEFVTTWFTKGKTEEKTLLNFFGAFTVLRKGGNNVKSVRKLIDEVAEQYKGLETFFGSYKALNDFIINQYWEPKPAIREAYFFPSESNEDYIINMLRTVKSTLDIAIFTLTNDRIFAAVEEAWNEGVEVRIITDDECCKQIGSDIYKLAALVN